MVKRNRNIVLVLLSIFLLAMVPALASAQGRGLAHRRDMSWKCRVFVNCHDARDGRWDGRGPRRSVGIFTPSGVLVNRRMRHRRIRDFDNEDRFREQRLRIRNRNFDNDEFLRGRDREFRNDNIFRGRGRGRPW